MNTTSSNRNAPKTGRSGQGGKERNTRKSSKKRAEQRFLNSLNEQERTLIDDYVTATYPTPEYTAPETLAYLNSLTLEECGRSEEGGVQDQNMNEGRRNNEDSDVRASGEDNDPQDNEGGGEEDAKNVGDTEDMDVDKSGDEGNNVNTNENSTTADGGDDDSNNSSSSSSKDGESSSDDEGGSQRATARIPKRKKASTASTALVPANRPATQTTQRTQTVIGSFLLKPIRTGILDYQNNNNDRKAYYKAIASKIEFDCNAGELQNFIVVLKNHGAMYGWTSAHGGSGLLDIPNDSTDLAKGRKSILDKYGEIPKTAVRNFVLSFFGKRVRVAQDDMMLAQYLLNTLSGQGMSKVYVRDYQFMIKETVSGLFLLKTILDVSRLQTNASVIRLKQQLTLLTKTIADLEWNIEKFNEHVLGVELKLNQNGTDAPDLYFQVLTAYETCPQAHFKAYIQRVRDSYEENPVANCHNAKELMNNALSRYLTIKEDGKWDTESDESKTLLTLESRIERIVKKRLKEAGKGKGKGKDKRNNKPTDISKLDKKSRRENDWKTQKPKKGEPQTSDIEGKTFHWCSVENGAKKGKGCNMWTVHHPRSCKGNDFKRKCGNDRDTSKREKKQKKRALKVEEATSAIMEIDSSDEDNSSDSE